VPTLYVVCSRGEFDPYSDWIEEAWNVIQTDHPECAGWSISHALKTDGSYGFDALDAFAVVARDPGPVLFLGRLQTTQVGLLEQKLTDRVVSRRSDATESSEVYEAILDLIARHHTGEPEVPRRLAVAVMLIAKLERMHYWGGNAKGFMSVSKLAKSNGLDEQYADTAHNVAEYLSSSKRQLRLMSTKLGDGSPKYACNNDERSRVYDFLRKWSIDDKETMQWLTRDSQKVPVRVLDAIRATNYDDQR
jgi:hypothetical protein